MAIIPDGTRVLVQGVSYELEGTVEHSYDTDRGRIYIIDFEPTLFLAAEAGNRSGEFWDGSGLGFHEKFVQPAPAHCPKCGHGRHRGKVCNAIIGKGGVCTCNHEIDK